MGLKDSTKSGNRIYCAAWHARMAELVDAPADAKQWEGVKDKVKLLER